MTEAYKIGITVALTNVISAELLKIIAQFGAADKASIGFASKLGLVASAATVVGVALAASVKEASKFETELAKFRMYGLGDKLNEDGKNFAMNMKIAGVNFTDTMHFMNEAQGVFRQSGRDDASALAGAKMAAPTLSKIAFIDKALYGKDDAAAHSPESLAMLRWIDMTGGATDAARFNELADVGFRLKTTSGGQIDWEQLRQFRARAKVAGFGFSDEMYASAEPIIGELKGSTAGFSLSTAYNRAHGITRLPNQAVGDMLKYGFWDKSKVELNKLGGIKQFSGDPLVDAEGYDKNFIKWYLEHVKPTYDKLGLTQTQRDRENALIFGSTGGNVMSLVDRQSNVIAASQTAFAKAHHIDQGYADAMGTPSGKTEAIYAEWAKLMTNIGETVLPAWNVALKATLSILEGANWLFKDSTDSGERIEFHGRRAVVVPPPSSGTKYVGETVVKIGQREVGRASTNYFLDGLAAPPSSGSGVDYRTTLQPVN
jgi:hypothetical protein